MVVSHVVLGSQLAQLEEEDPAETAATRPKAAIAVRILAEIEN